MLDFIIEENCIDDYTKDEVDICSWLCNFICSWFQTRGRNSYSNMCEKGAWPRSWQSPASWTTRMSLLVMPNSFCVPERLWTTCVARWLTPSECSKRLWQAPGKM